MANEKKVLQLISSEGFFGAENVVIELCYALKKNGIATTVGAFKNSHNSNLEIILRAKEKGLNTVVFDCKGKLDLNSIKIIRRYILFNNISLIHAHGYKADVYGFLATIGCKVKKVSTCHNWVGDSKKMKSYRMLDKLILGKFNSVVAVSKPIQNELISSGINKNKIKLIHNGVDVDRFSTNFDVSLRKEFGLQSSNKIIGTVGRLSEEKGHKFLLESFKEILVVIPEARLVIVGDGPLRKGLEQLCNKLGLDGKVVFTGTRNDIPELLSIFNIFVLSSLIEGLPVALLEAMAAKKPVVATRVGDIPSIIEDGVTGYLVEPKDAQGLQKRITDLLTDTNCAIQMSLKAHETIKQDFSLQNMANAYIRIYDYQ